MAKGLVDSASRFFAKGAGNAGGSGRGANKLKSDPAVKGSSHSTFKTDPNTKKVTNYETYEYNPKNPNGVEKVKRYDGTGERHFNKYTKEYVNTPHVLIKTLLVEYENLIQMKCHDSKGGKMR
jgi:hypothetical protein